MHSLRYCLPFFKLYSFLLCLRTKWIIGYFSLLNDFLHKCSLNIPALMLPCHEYVFFFIVWNFFLIFWCSKIEMIEVIYVQACVIMQQGHLLKFYATRICLNIMLCHIFSSCALLHSWHQLTCYPCGKKSTYWSAAGNS